MCLGKYFFVLLGTASRLKTFYMSFFFFFKFNNFILRWYCTIAEANKNQSFIAINMVKILFFYLRRLEADTKVISMWQPYTDMSIPH